MACSNPLVVRLISDYSCPFCFLAFVKLVQGIALLPADLQNNVKIEAGVFQLNGSLPKKGINKKEYLRSMLGSGYDSAFKDLKMKAEPWNIYMREGGLIGNSFDAHRITLEAEDQGLGIQMVGCLCSECRIIIGFCVS